MKKSNGNDLNLQLKKSFENPYLFFMNLMNKKTKKRNLSYSQCHTPVASFNKSIHERNPLSARNKRLSDPDVLKRISNNKAEARVKKTPQSNSSHVKSNSTTIPSLVLQKQNINALEKKYGNDLKLNLNAIKKQPLPSKNNDYYIFDRSIFSSRKSSLPTNKVNRSAANQLPEKPLTHRKPIKPKINPMKINIVNANNYLMINNDASKRERSGIRKSTSPQKKSKSITPREKQKSLDIRRIEAKTNSQIEYNDQTEVTPECKIGYFPYFLKIQVQLQNKSRKSHI